MMQCGCLYFQTRSFQYVSDLVNGLVALMNGNYSGPVNLGNPDEYTMLEFAEKIKRVRLPDTTHPMHTALFFYNFVLIFLSTALEM